MDNDTILYKMHIWNDFDKDTSDSGTRYDWNTNNNETSKRRYSCETEISGETINKQIIKYSTYDIQLYNAITNLISDILGSPLREELSSPVIFYSKDDKGIAFLKKEEDGKDDFMIMWLPGFKKNRSFRA